MSVARRMKKNRKRKEKALLTMASASDDMSVEEEGKSSGISVLDGAKPAVVEVEHVEDGVGSESRRKRKLKRKRKPAPADDVENANRVRVQGLGAVEQEAAITRICNPNRAEKIGFEMIPGNNCLGSDKDMNVVAAVARTSEKLQSSRKKRRRSSERESVKEEDGSSNRLSLEIAKATLLEGRASEKIESAMRKELKRSEREGVKEDGSKNVVSLSLETAKGRLLEGRVWQYVCQRALIGDTKGSIRNPPHLVVKSFDISDPIATSQASTDLRRNPLSGLKSPSGMVSKLGASQALHAEKQLLSLGIKPLAASAAVAEFPNFNLTKPGYGNKTTVTNVIANGNKIAVTVTKEGTIVQDWILRQKARVYGMDSEWRPSYVKGVEHKTALLQICGESECLMIQMLFIDAVPPALVNFLKDPKIQLAGVGIHGDIQKLQRDHGLECNGAIELTTLAAKKYERVDLKGAGLKALAKLVINFDMVKQKKVTMSNWANRCLDQIQLEYACLDAWVSYAIHEGLVEGPAL
ncbi:unnamed protein product [Sphagnum jensenii]|uniref:3'-5' exonuclease domain-containing protein n=1 Tax=Sphagnum jensenii TaxID=128206 RepID=A0ABP0WCN8_9BRYO